MNLPDTLLVKEASALLARAAPEPLAAHSIRTFLLGKAWGEGRGVAFDEEALCLAALFHDLGLCPEHRVPGLPFPLASSRALRAHLTARGWPTANIAPLEDAIDFHMQLFPRWSKGPVAGLLQVGAWMDLTGRRRREIRTEARAIAAAHPGERTTWPFWKDVLGVALTPRACVGYMLPARFRHISSERTEKAV